MKRKRRWLREIFDQLVEKYPDMLTKIFILLAALTLAGAGCSLGDTATTSDDRGGVPHLTGLAGSRVVLDHQGAFKTGRSDISFTLYGLKGQALGPDDLKIQHEKKMHVIIVRDDMTQFQHVHPAYAGKRWSVEVTIPEQGAYQMYVDIAPEGETAAVLRVPIVVGGQTIEREKPVPVIDFSTEINGYRAVLAFDAAPLKTQEHTTLTFTLTKNGKPIEKIDPYLGAFGHVVLIRHGDPDDFFHVHPLTEVQPTQGQVAFDAQFPVRGRYTIYAQFAVEGRVLTFPITVDVNETGGGADAARGHGGGGAHR